MGECYMCRGKKQVFCHVDYADRTSTTGWRDCFECGGSGEMSEERLADYAYGQEFREARLNRGETLRECAKRLGVSASDLSAMEQGRLPLVNERANPQSPTVLNADLSGIKEEKP